MAKFFVQLSIAFVLGLISLPCHAAVTIISKDMEMTHGEDGPTRLFARIGNRQVALPVRTTYKSRLSSTDKNIWAINFHATSDYDDVDLVVYHHQKLSIVLQSWLKIERQCLQKKIIPRWPFDHLYFEVKRVHKLNLWCRFYGASHQKQADYEKYFLIRLRPTRTGVRLVVR